MIENERIRALLTEWIDKRQIAGAVVRIHKDGKVVCDAQYGYADIENKRRMDTSSIFRLASMTKPVIAAAAMLLVEEGKLGLDDLIETHLPEFADMKAADKNITFEEYYQADPDNPMLPKMNVQLLNDIKEVKAKRSITIRDILSHSSGMGHGPVSMARMEDLLKPECTMKERIKIFSETLLDFQPGEDTGYSAATAFDVLGHIIEVISGMNLDMFVKEKICRPLGMQNTGFILSEKQREQIVKLYEAAENGLTDVSDTEPFWKLMNPAGYGYFSGSAGLMGTVEDYDRLAQMFLHNGMASGKVFLQEETIGEMSHEASKKHMLLMPGTTWGLGMMVTENPEEAGRKTGKGTFGWSGAYGTHFYVDRENQLTVVLGVNRSNIGGADSELSKQLEETVFQEFGCR